MTQPTTGITLSRAASEAAWQQALDGRPGATVFHEWSWLTVHAQLQGWRFEPLLASYGGRVVGVVPLLLRRKGPFWVPALNPFPFAGPVVAAEHLPAVLREIPHWSARRRIVSNRLDFYLPGDEQADVLRESGAALDFARTWIVDVSHHDVQKLESGFDRNTRKCLRIAGRHGVETREATAAEAAVMLPQLLDEAFTAHGATNPYAYTRQEWEALLEISGAYIAGAYQDGRCIGILVAPAAGGTVMAWVGGCLRGSRETRANFALHVHLFKWALEQGYDSVDLVGEVDPGVAAFKAGFGAQPHEFVMANQRALKSHAIDAAIVALRRHPDQQPATA